jgi:hypothetical protein
MSELGEKKASVLRRGKTGVGTSKPTRRKIEITEPSPATVPTSAEPLPDYELDADAPRIKQKLLALLGDMRVRVVALLLILGIITWIVSPPLYRKAKVWRALSLMDQCQRVADQGNVPQAISLMRRAIIMAPNNQEVFRRVRLFNAGMGDAAALHALQNGMIEKTAEPDELLVLAEQAILSDNRAVAQEAVGKIQDQPSARKIIVEMKLRAKEGNPQAAVDLARASLSQFPVEEAEKILIATAELILKSDVKTSQEILIPLANKNNTNGIGALRLLASQQMQLPGKGALTPLQISDAILAHPLHSFADKLMAADLKILADPAGKATVIDWLRQGADQSNNEEKIAFARWLNRRQSYQQAIDFIGKERATSDPAWLLIYLDAHAGLDRWGDVFTMLDAETVIGLSDSIRLLFLARAAQKSGEVERSEEIWREMQRGLLYEKPEVVSFVAAYAMRIGEQEQALRAYTTLSRRKDTALEGFLGIIRCWPQNRSVVELIPVYEEFLGSFPGIEEARSDYTYLQLLTNRNLFDASGVARDIYARNPHSLASLSVAALALLKMGDVAQADQLYEGKSIIWSSAPAPWIAVRTAVLQAAGKTDEARRLAATVNKNKLRPEEQDLLPPE